MTIKMLHLSSLGIQENISVVDLAVVWKYKGRSICETSAGYGTNGGYELNYLEKSCDMSEVDTF